MTNETIVAVFDSEANAAAAARELANAGVPLDAITQHARDRVTRGSDTTPAPKREPGFWERLFGGEPERAHDTSVYDRSLEGGSTVVTIQAEEQDLTMIMDILERHAPIDIDERGAGYVDIDAVKQHPPAMSESSTTRTAPALKISEGSERRDGRSKDEQSMPLAEETLAVGKRAINRGTTRIRRYVIETPVEEQVNLRSESVTVERRPVTNAHPITDANFSDKVVEVTETDEEPVVSKTARIKEEVVIHKDATNRTETVRDKVRREEAEVTKEGGADSGLSSTEAIKDSSMNQNKPGI